VNLKLNLKAEVAARTLQLRNDWRDECYCLDADADMDVGSVHT